MPIITTDRVIAGVDIGLALVLGLCFGSVLISFSYLCVCLFLCLFVCLSSYPSLSRSTCLSDLPVSASFCAY